MQTLKIGIQALALIFSISCIPTLYAQEESKVDPEVIERIEEMGKHLRSLKKFTVKSDFTFEIVTEDNQKFEYPGTLEYKVITPNKLFAELKTDHKHRKYYYDGASMTIYDPQTKFYGQIAAPGSIGELMEKVETQYGIVLPMEDLFVWGTDKASNETITMANFIGETKVGEQSVEQFALRQGKVDWQIWVSKGKTPLPLKLVYTANDDPTRPQLSANLKWNTKAEIKNQEFKFKAPKDSFKIELNPSDDDVVAKQKANP